MSPGNGVPGTQPTEPWRVPETDSRVWARGKTAEEVLGIATQLATAVQTYVQQGQPPATPQPRNDQGQWTAAPPAPAQPQYNPDDFVTNRDVERFGQQAVNQWVAPQLQQMQESLAQSNLDQVKREYPREFAKYGPEIYANLAGMSNKAAWTIDNLRKVVKVSLVDHVEDLARERAERVVAEMVPTLRSTGAGQAPISQNQPDLTLKSEKLPEDWRQRAAEKGLTEAALDEFCRANDMSREDWFKLFEKTAITEITRRG